ncbi:MAG: hypothetical protein GY801_33935 [bacterium]|nr:hypothetical protein [bacterium]
MDPITIAIIAGVAAGLTEVSESAVKDAYNSLKAIIKKKFGDKNAVNDAVVGVENNPDSKAREAVLTEEVAKTGADKDSDVLKAVETLTEALEQQAKSTGKANFDIEKVKAANIMFKKLRSEGGDASFHIGVAEASGDFTVEDVHLKAKK